MINSILALILEVAKKLILSAAPEALELAKQFGAVGALYVLILTDADMSQEEKRALYDTETETLKQLVAAAVETGSIELRDLPSSLLTIVGSEVTHALGIS